MPTLPADYSPLRTFTECWQDADTNRQYRRRVCIDLQDIATIAEYAYDYIELYEGETLVMIDTYQGGNYAVICDFGHLQHLWTEARRYAALNSLSFRAS